VFLPASPEEEMSAPSELLPAHRAQHPHPNPSPIEGEGLILVVERSAGILPAALAGGYARRPDRYSAARR
jgi:hypothetical protein